MKIPLVIKGKQLYRQPEIANVREETEKILAKYNFKNRISPGNKIAITAGSRGIANIVEIMAQVVEEVKKCGGEPFIIPAMGSHGGGTAEGQRALLESLGITEESVKAPIRATMDVVQIGETEFHTAVYIDRFAYEADGIIVMGRVKKHTDHHNKTESGLMKMMTIGLGKQKQAELIHSYGVWGLVNMIPPHAKEVIKKAKIIVGIAIIENALDKTAYIEAVEAKNIPEREVELFKMSVKHYPWLPFRTCDVLVIKRAGKNISGTGMDTNIIGRYGTWGSPEPEKLYAAGCDDFGSPLIEHVAVLDLTEESHGNAIGIGQADVITKKFYNKIDFQATYNNVITSAFLEKGKIPIIAENDQQAIMMVLNTLSGLTRLEGRKNEENVKMCIIDSTLHHGNFLVSKGFYEELNNRGDIIFEGQFHPLKFDNDGNLQN